MFQSKNNYNYIFLVSFLLNIIINTNLVIAAGKIDFSYSGENAAAYWHKLENSAEICLTGKRQSPIDISLDDFQHHSHPPEDIKVEKAYDVEIEYDGHTIQVSNGEEGLPLSFRLNGKLYQLLQFHFHTPSENLLDGKYFDMEAHFVFTTNRTPQAELSVVAVLYRIGSENQFLIPIIENVSIYIQQKLLFALHHNNNHKFDRFRPLLMT